MKIGIFDSGVGGKSFIEVIAKRFPEAEIIYIDDKKNIPYGDKTPAELLKLSLPLFRQFEQQGCLAVLVACNTITTNIIHELRKNIRVPLIGIEPMVKTAAQLTKTGTIAVCATPATLASERYAFLKSQAGGVKVEEPDCRMWALMIEQNRMNELELASMVDALRDKHVDILVLGCTHYHWIEDRLRALAKPDMQVIQPTEPIMRQLERVVQGATKVDSRQ